MSLITSATIKQHILNYAYNRLIWLYKKANFALLKQKLLKYDWNCLSEGTLDEACNKFNDIFFNFVRSCILSKNVLIRPDDKPWYDSEIRKMSRKRDRLKRKFNKTGNQNILTRYIFFRNKVNNLKSHAKEQF